MTRRGRPRRLKAERTDARVVSYFSKTEKEQLQKLADRDSDGSISELIRSLVSDLLDAQPIIRARIIRG
jgi:hypothetical protein